MKKVKYPAYGLWKVTTEGDCEGRSVRQLGTHEGYIDEIAFKLAKQCFYSLNFKLLDANEHKDMTPTGTKVHITLDIDSGTWDMTHDARVDHFRDILKDREVDVSPGMYYASVVLIDGASPEVQELRRREFIRNATIKKLTPEELEILDIKVT